MSAAEQQWDYYTVEEYLAAEAVSPTKHEYVSGRVYAMAGASGPHNVIAGNLAGLLYNSLRGSGCRFFGSDMRLQFSQPDQRYYYPDGMVLCDPADFARNFSDHPTVIFEILSEETRIIDEREKSPVFRLIPGLEAYVFIEQERADVLVVRRTAVGWKGDHFIGLDAVAEIGSRQLALPLAELYRDVIFPHP